jgi:hypothetical protein
MQDYGQPGGAYPPQQPPAAPPKKKGGKGLMIIGVILLIVGILIAVVGLIPSMGAKSVDDLDDVEDGDTLTLQGEITEEGDASSLSALGLTGLSGGYVYIIDDKAVLLSSEDLGSKGDSITVECEAHMVGEIGYLEATAIVNPMPLIIVGVILLIVGVLLMIVGIVKRKKSG